VQKDDYIHLMALSHQVESPMKQTQLTRTELVNRDVEGQLTHTNTRFPVRKGPGHYSCRDIRRRERLVRTLELVQKELGVFICFQLSS
jgi:hypothetical protein